MAIVDLPAKTWFRTATDVTYAVLYTIRAYADLVGLVQCLYPKLGIFPAVEASLDHSCWGSRMRRCGACCGDPWAVMSWKFQRGAQFKLWKYGGAVLGRTCGDLALSIGAIVAAGSTVFVTQHYSGAFQLDGHDRVTRSWLAG